MANTNWRGAPERHAALSVAESSLPKGPVYSEPPDHALMHEHQLLLYRRLVMLFRKKEWQIHVVVPQPLPKKEGRARYSGAENIPTMSNSIYHAYAGGDDPYGIISDQCILLFPATELTPDQVDVVLASVHRCLSDPLHPEDADVRVSEERDLIRLFIKLKQPKRQLQPKVDQTSATKGSGGF